LEVSEFLKLLRSCGSRAEIQQRIDAARKKGLVDCVGAGNSYLNDWKPKPSRQRTAGRTAVQVHFFREGECFSTAKDAYIWLIRKMLSYGRDQVVNDNLANFVLNIRRTNPFLAESAVELFPKSPHLASDSNYYVIVEGVFLSLNLKNEQKRANLQRLGEFVGLVENEDWSWKLDGEQ